VNGSPEEAKKKKAYRWGMVHRNGRDMVHSYHLQPNNGKELKARKAHQYIYKNTYTYNHTHTTQ